MLAVDVGERKIDAAVRHACVRRARDDGSAHTSLRGKTRLSAARIVEILEQRIGRALGLAAFPLRNAHQRSQIGDCALMRVHEQSQNKVWYLGRIV